MGPPRLVQLAIRRHARALAGVVVVSLLSALAASLTPWPLKVLIDEALGQERIVGRLVELSPMGLITAAAVAALLIALLAAVLNAAVVWLWSRIGQQMVYDLSRSLFGHMQRLSLRFHHKANVGDLLHRLTGDSYCVYMITESLLITPVYQLLTIGIMVVLAWQLDPGLTLVLLATAPLLAAVAWWTGPRLRRVATARQRSRAALVSFVQQTLTAMPVVQSFCAEQRNRQQFHGLAQDAARDARRGAWLNDAFGALNGLLLSVGFAVVLYLGGMRVLAGAMTIGSLLVFVAYARSLQSAFLALMQAYSGYQNGKASLERVYEVFASDQVLPEPEHPEPLLAGRARADGRVRFDNVCFGYDPGLSVLSNITLDVQAGQTIALVGPTGAGKTTLASMIPRFFDPWEGAVFVDDHDTRALSLRELRSQVSIVLQQPFLLPRSIAENIRYGRPDASMQQVVAAARAANADAFIRKLPEGYDTVLGERGVSLSGGERQRLAIARAMLIDAPIVILDEPTSALDADSELVVMDAIEQLTAHRTTFIIAHRLSTARRADRIAVLDGGRLVECGSHDELMALGGRYARMTALQSMTGEVGS